MRNRAQGVRRLLVLLPVMAALSGCDYAVHRPVRALASATAPVLEQASAAYRDTNVLNERRQDFEAYADFDRKDPVYDPRKIEPVLTERDIAVRLEVLEAFQLYVETLGEVTDGTSSPELDAAAQAVGANLAGVSNDLAGVIAEASSGATPVTPTVRNGISTAVNALAQVLVARKVRREVPPVVLRMDPEVARLCQLLEGDVDVLQGRERRDYNTLINLQTLFVRTSPGLSPEDRRNEIMKLPGMVREQRSADARLTVLRASLVQLQMAHRAVADAVRAGDKRSFKAKLAELVAAGRNLGTFYGSLPTS